MIHWVKFRFQEKLDQDVRVQLDSSIVKKRMDNTWVGKEFV